VTASTAKPEEKRLNKFARASDNQPGNRKKNCHRDQKFNPVHATGTNNRTTRKNGLIEAKKQSQHAGSGILLGECRLK